MAPFLGQLSLICPAIPIFLESVKICDHALIKNPFKNRLVTFYPKTHLRRI